jgi:hypothetical protein
MGSNKKRISRLIDLFENNAKWTRQDVVDFGYDFKKKIMWEKSFKEKAVNWEEYLIKYCLFIEEDDEIEREKALGRLNAIVAKYLGYVEYYYFYKKIVTSKEFLNLPISKITTNLKDDEMLALKIFLDLKGLETKDKQELKKGRRSNTHRDIFVGELLNLYQEHLPKCRKFYRDFFILLIMPLKDLERYKKESIGTTNYMSQRSSWRDVCNKVQRLRQKNYTQNNPSSY